tara:strand:+ start:400 stop:684 length:285 start_codon:yes stop_codon:yes gene_type:complete
MEKKILSVFAIALVVIAFTSCSKDDACMTCGTQYSLNDDASDEEVAMWNAAGLDDLDVTAEYCGDDLTQIQSSPGMDESVTMDMDYYTVTTGCW